MENVEVNGGDLRKFFASYWLLHSAIYNFAQGFNNQEKRRLTWAITNYYYSLVFMGRLLMFLPTDMYYVGHKEVASFLEGEEVKRKKALKFNENGVFEEITVYANLENNTHNREKIKIEEVASDLGVDIRKIKNFGKILKQMKDFRNKNTYESFVIYAQECHAVLTKFIFSATNRIREVTEHYLTEACKVFFNFWRRKSEQFVTLLNHEWLIRRTLKILDKHDLPAERVETIINKEFYFENEKVYRNDLIRVRSIMERKPDVRLSKRFEETCDISTFGAKERVVDDVFSNFRNLIEIDRCGG